MRLVDGKWSPSTCNKSRVSGSGCANGSGPGRPPAGQKQQGRTGGVGQSSDAQLGVPASQSGPVPALPALYGCQVRVSTEPTTSRNGFTLLPFCVRKPACPAQLPGLIALLMRAFAGDYHCQ